MNGDVRELPRGGRQAQPCQKQCNMFPLPTATREWRTQLVYGVQETLLKSEEMINSASWKRVSITIIWVDGFFLKISMRHRRPPQIAKYTVNIPSPRGTSHQRKYLGSPTPVCPVASPPQIRTRKGDKLRQATQPLAIGPIGLSTHDRDRQRKRLTEIQ
jgi:hypothetical protein